MPRRNVDQQIADLPAGDCFQMLDDRVDVPAGDERRGRLDDRPSLADELPQAAGSHLRVNLVPEGGSCQQWRVVV